MLGAERATRVANLFRRTDAADPQLSKLVHSSLDMDRLDYLIRDSGAAGVPYGQVDLNYLLNNFKASPSGAIGVPDKAITAVDHFLLGRFFMYRTVYFHKTTFGLEGRNRPLAFRLLHVLEFAGNGDIKRENVWIDLASIMQQLPQD